MTTNRPLVTVVTLTHDRPDVLPRAAASVVAQRGVRVQHLVLGDACPRLGDPAWAAAFARRFPDAEVVNVRRADHPEMPDGYLPARLAFLRNLGTRRARGEFVAQLDDDNAFHPEHLVRLVRALEATAGAEAAHSWRRVLRADGTPFRFGADGEDLWHPVAGERAEAFRRLCALGVFVPGSEVVRDALRAQGRALARVDTSEYLARRSLMERIPFPETYSAARQRLGYTEDLAFSHELIRRKVVVACSESATLDYYLGGYSNEDALPAAPAGSAR